MDQKLNYKKALMLATCSTLCIKTDDLDYTKNYLIAVTAAGVIHGTYISGEVEKALENDISYITCRNISQIAAEESCDSPGAILLKDATLTTGQGLKQPFNYLFLFPDDVIALSFGNFPNN